MLSHMSHQFRLRVCCWSCRVLASSSAMRVKTQFWKRLSVGLQWVSQYLQKICWYSFIGGIGWFRVAFSWSIVFCFVIGAVLLIFVPPFLEDPFSQVFVSQHLV